MEMFRQLIDIFLHLDQHLNDMAGTLGGWLYLVLFLIIFCETGFVVTPFLPGDSLLFAVGALAAIDGSPLRLELLLLLLFMAAVWGDAVNYAIGFRVGPRVFTSEKSRLLNKKHLVRTQRFYEKHGGKTIVIARFLPIIRTFAPFVAGIGQMRYRHFALYNVTGGAAWIFTFLLGGYFFGSIDVVKRNFHLIVVALVIIPGLPALIEFLLAVRRRDTDGPVPDNVPLEHRSDGGSPDHADSDKLTELHKP
jgi:membrane-associated protein